MSQPYHLNPFPVPPRSTGLFPHPLGSPGHDLRINEPAGFLWPLIHPLGDLEPVNPLGLPGRWDPWPAALDQGGQVSVLHAPMNPHGKCAGTRRPPGRAGGKGPAAAVDPRTIFFIFSKTHVTRYPMGTRTHRLHKSIPMLESCPLWNH